MTRVITMGRDIPSFDPHFSLLEILGLDVLLVIYYLISQHLDYSSERLSLMPIHQHLILKMNSSSIDCQDGRENSLERRRERRRGRRRRRIRKRRRGEGEEDAPTHSFSPFFSSSQCSLPLTSLFPSTSSKGSR